MPPSMTAGSSSAALAQFLHRCVWPSPRVHWLGTPKIPIIRFRWGDGFAASLVRCSLRPVELLAPLTDLTGHFAQPTGTFTPEPPASRSPFSSSGITTVATERFHRWDFHPLERQLASLHGLLHPPQTCRFSPALSGLLYKRRSQEKKLRPRPEVFLLRSPTDRTRSVLTYRSRCSVVGHDGPMGWVFSSSGFHRLVRDEACSVPKPAKQNGGQVGDHGSIWDS